MDEGPGKWISPSDGALLSIAVNVYTNRMNGASYDIAGNVTWDGVHTFQYDPFGQPREISESGGLIVYPIYDADGERIGLVTEGSNEWKWTPRDLGGKVAREYVGLGGSVGQPQNFFYVWKEDYVYRGGLLAGAVREMAEGGLRHFHLDHLGTPRV
ncbi:MAG: hypothetical protein ABI718_15950, partial [Acidobacteriota bacterium]